jgi:gliding motility-associated-like protein
VVIQDANLCKGIFKFEVMQPDKLILKMSTSEISCYGADDGKALVSGIGGTGAYKYLWNDPKSQSSDEAKNLSPAIYTVTVTDENGCIEIAKDTLENPPKLDIKTLKLKDVLCFNDRTGELQFVGIGGRPPYKYSLDGVVFQKGDLFKDLAAGNYSLTVKDSAGCEYQLPVILRQPSPFVVDAGSDKTIELGESSNLNAITSPANNLVKSWMWTPADSTLTCKDCNDPTATPYNTTTYTIKAVDETGCQAIDRVTIVVIKNRNVFFPNIFSPGNDDGVNDRYTGFSGRAVRKINLIRIYDRWGNLIFERENFATNDLNFGWDGTYRGQKSGSGVYTFYSNVEFIDGEIITYKGDFMLVR